MSGVPEGVCLQCGESRERIEKNSWFCVTLSGYETPEVQDEWKSHHYRDWSDAELKRLGIKEHMWEENRRTSVYDLDFAVAASYCEDNGHAFPENDDLGVPETRCFRCWTDTSKEE